MEKNGLKLNGINVRNCRMEGNDAVMEVAARGLSQADTGKFLNTRWLDNAMAGDITTNFDSIISQNTLDESKKKTYALSTFAPSITGQSASVSTERQYLLKGNLMLAGPFKCSVLNSILHWQFQMSE